MGGWATLSQLDSRFRLFRSIIGAAINSDFPLGGLLRFTRSYFLAHLILSRFLTAMFNSTYRITHNHRIGVQESRLANVRHVVLWVQLLTRYFEPFFPALRHDEAFMTFRLDRGTAKLLRLVLPDCPDGPYGRRCQSQRNVYLGRPPIAAACRGAESGGSACHR